MMRRLKGGRFHYDFVGRAKTWLVTSGLIVLVSVGSMLFLKLNLGLEFKGGTSFEVKTAKNVTVEQMKKALESVNVKEPTIQRVGDDGYLIQTSHLGVDLQRNVSEVIGRTSGVTSNDVNVTDVGPKWGAEVSKKAVQALITFLVLVGAYIALRFEWKMAVTALIALFHDIMIAAGIYAITGFAITPATIIALLTILGYSLYDTVIVFDRVREKTRTVSAGGKQTYSEIANDSLNQVLVRSLNTTLTSLLPVGSLLFVGSFLLGATTLRELALALFLGIAAGTYSSIFVAVPLLAVWKEREPRWAQLRARIAARQAEPTASRARTEAGPAQAASPSGVSTATLDRPAGRPPKRKSNKRKKKR